MLAKNSDREPNEPHIIRFFPAQEHTGNEQLRCTYVSIPQVSHTNAVLLFKPDWIWGAEMGVNEHGVAIGNEAVFTKAKNPREALTGMDLLVLALSVRIRQKLRSTSLSSCSRNSGRAATAAIRTTSVTTTVF